MASQSMGRLWPWLALLVQVASPTPIARTRLSGAMPMRGGGSGHGGMSEMLSGAMLMRGGGSDGQSPTKEDMLLSDACCRGDHEAAQAILEAGANPDLASPRPAPRGSTLLMAVCQDGYESCVQVLLQAGADTDLTSSDGSIFAETPSLGPVRVCQPPACLYVEEVQGSLPRDATHGTYGVCVPASGCLRIPCGAPQVLRRC